MKELFAEARRMGEAFAESDASRAWLTPDGALAAIAKRADVGTRYSDLHTVVTKPSLRRHGYASALLSDICRTILAEGRTPMLYAECENETANRVYRSLGLAESHSTKAENRISGLVKRSCFRYTE